MGYKNKLVADIMSSKDQDFLIETIVSKYKRENEVETGQLENWIQGSKEVPNALYYFQIQALLALAGVLNAENENITANFFDLLKSQGLEKPEYSKDLGLKIIAGGGIKPELEIDDSLNSIDRFADYVDQNIAA